MAAAVVDDGAVVAVGAVVVAGVVGVVVVGSRTITTRPTPDRRS